MYKIGVIGDKDSVLGFMAIGYSVYPVQDIIEAAETLQRLAREEFAIIFVTEELARDISHIIDKYKSEPLPAIICIPGKTGTTGYGMNNIKKSVERAIGADILFKNE